MRNKSDEQYRRVLVPFILWLITLGVAPSGGPHIDDMLCEYQAGSDQAPPVSRSNFEKLIAAVEKVLPHVKGELMLSRAILTNWKACFGPRHALPMTPDHALLVGIGLIMAGMAPLGGLVVLQALRGLRPGDTVGLRGGDLVPGRSPHAARGSPGIILLGPNTGTKSGHPQAVRCITALANLILNVFALITPPGEQLTHIRTLGGYAIAISRGAKWAKIKADWKPHSGRAGFCTQAFLEGASPAAIAAVTRHTSIKSLRSYVDATSVLAGKLAHDMAASRPTVDYLIEQFGRIWVGEMIRTGRAPASAWSLVPQTSGPLLEFS